MFSHDFDFGFVRTTGTILAPLVLKTVFVFESYLKGRRSSFAIFVPAVHVDPRWGFRNTKVGVKLPWSQSQLPRTSF